MADSAGGPTAPHGVYRYVPWLALCLLATAACAWLSLRVGREFAPVLLFPLITGAVLGGTAALLARFAGMDHRGAGLCGVALCALVLVGWQHVAAWRHWRRLMLAAAQQAQAAPPGRVAASSDDGLGLLPFLRSEADAGRAWLGGRWRGAAAWCTWVLDAGILVAGACLAFAYFRRSAFPG